MNKRYKRNPLALFVLAAAGGVVLIAVGVLMLFVNAAVIAPAVAVCGAVLMCVSISFMLSRKRIMNRFLNTVSENENQITANVLEAFPLPILSANIDGTVRWCNEPFEQLIGKGVLLGRQVSSIINGIKWGNILKNASEICENVNIDGRRYELIGRLVCEGTAETGEKIYGAYLYLVDMSSYDTVLRLYEAQKTDVAVICIDNYDEVVQRVDEDAGVRIASGVRKVLNTWAQKGGAVLKRQDDDRYYLIFDHAKLNGYIEDNFSVLKDVRNVGTENNAPVSVSIGIGTGGSLVENDSYARNAMEMTQGRGGDQVCIKNVDSFKFYGGSAKEYERSNRVKTRAFAGALKTAILESDRVFLMGHANADYDCFGAAMGMQRAVRALGKIPYIVLDNNSPAVRPMREALGGIEEYKDLFIEDEVRAVEEITGDSLLIILDTHRPSMLPRPQLTRYTKRIVVIDHHRRSTEFINPCMLFYQETYASSTCEMVTELVNYMDIGKKLSREEAECLYSGILMDTKNFLVKTSVRTFEAASYLRKLGINTLAVKKLFNVNKIDYDHKVDIVKTSVEIARGIALAEAMSIYPNIRVIASQAADEMLNIGNIQASIVIYPMQVGYGVCARSIGNINVQLIMEELGGGGHSTIAGAQLATSDIEAAKRSIIGAVHKCLEEV